MALLEPVTFYLFRGKEKVVPKDMTDDEKQELLEAVSLRQQVTSIEQEVETMKAAAKAMADEIMEKYELTGVLVVGHGLLKRYTNKSTFYSKDKIAKSLLEQGVDSDIIKEAIEAGKSTSIKPGTISWDPKTKALKE